MATAACFAVGAVLVVFLASSVRAFVLLLPRHFISDQYIGTLYYVDYSHGFVRRGLPGELIALVWRHSRSSSEVAGWTLTILAVVAVVVIALRAARLVAGTTSRLLVVSLVLLSPLSVTTVLRDPGRYDAIGLVLMGWLIWWTSVRAPRPALLLSFAVVATAIAVACEEFLILYLAPVVVALVYRHVPAGGRRRLDGRSAVIAALCLVPAAAVALASAAVTPSASYIAEIERVANPSTKLNPAYFLGLSLHGNVSYVASHGWRYVIATGAIWLFVYVLTVVAISIATGRTEIWYWASAAYFALTAIAISIVALDARRWWTLALLGHVTVAGIAGIGERSASRARSPKLRPAAGIVVALALAVSVYAQSLPKTVIRPSSIAGTAYGDHFVSFWFRGSDLP